MESIDLTKKELSEIIKGETIYKDINDMLTIQIKEYTIGEQMADETEKYEIIFESDTRKKT